jgi:hypothetical protein
MVDESQFDRILAEWLQTKTAVAEFVPTDNLDVRVKFVLDDNCRIVQVEVKHETRPEFNETYSNRTACTHRNAILFTNAAHSTTASSTEKETALKSARRLFVYFPNMHDKTIWLVCTSASEQLYFAHQWSAHLARAAF